MCEHAQCGRKRPEEQVLKYWE